MKAPIHGKKHTRSSRIDICRVFADRPFDEEFEESRLRQPISISPKRGILRCSLTPVDMVQKLQLVCHTPMPTEGFLAMLDDPKRNNNDLPSIGNIRPSIMIKRKCRSNEPKQRVDTSTSQKPTLQSIRQPTEAVAAAVSQTKRRLSMYRCN